MPVSGTKPKLRDSGPLRQRERNQGAMLTTRKETRREQAEPSHVGSFNGVGYLNQQNAENK